MEVFINRNVWQIILITINIKDFVVVYIIRNVQKLYVSEIDPNMNSINFESHVSSKLKGSIFTNIANLVNYDITEIPINFQQSDCGEKDNTNKKLITDQKRVNNLT